MHHKCINPLGKLLACVKRPNSNTTIIILLQLPELWGMPSTWASCWFVQGFLPTYIIGPGSVMLLRFFRYLSVTHVLHMTPRRTRPYMLHQDFRPVPTIAAAASVRTPAKDHTLLLSWTSMTFMTLQTLATFLSLQWRQRKGSSSPAKSTCYSQSWEAQGTQFTHQASS